MVLNVECTKLTIVVGIIVLAIAAMFVGYGQEIFWIAIAALSGLGGYELKREVEKRRQMDNDTDTTGRDKR